jgi:hypothetical protein
MKQEEGRKERKEGRGKVMSGWKIKEKVNEYE